MTALHSICSFNLFLSHSLKSHSLLVLRKTIALGHICILIKLKKKSESFCHNKKTLSNSCESDSHTILHFKRSFTVSISMEWTLALYFVFHFIYVWIWMDRLISTQHSLSTKPLWFVSLNNTQTHTRYTYIELW